MNLVVRKRASFAIAKTGVWIEKKNTEGSGARWIKKVYEALENQARIGVKHDICQDDDFARQLYRCFTYNGKWVVAYRVVGDDFIIYRFVWGAKLV